MAGFNPRADGATRADLAEATAMVVAGAALVFLPVVALLDKQSEGWLWFSAVAGGVGALFGLLGLRWFLVEGPALAAFPASDEPGAAGGVDLPVRVRLVEARARLTAHALRFAALGGGALLVFVDLGPLNYVVLVLFGLSFVADHLLLRPQRYVLDDEGLHGLWRPVEFSWGEVQAVHWRHYPGKRRPPFPGGERIIVEREGGDDLEFVLHRRYGGTDGLFFVRAVLPMLQERVRSLRPREGTADRDQPPLAEELGQREGAP
jgi:hypothetical protein